jgi:ubiquitin carboxyl-terminal hydrolase 34
VAYSALTLRMARIDCQTLRECAADVNVSQDLVSHRYLNSLTLIMSPTGSTLWKALYDFCHFNSRPTITSIITRFTGRPGTGVKCLSHISKGLLDRSQTIPSLTQRLWVPLTAMNRIMHHYNTLLETHNELHQTSAQIQALQAVPFEAYDLFQAVDATLQTFVSKQVSALSLETCQSLVQQLSSLLLSIAVADEDSITHRLRERLGLGQEFDNCVGSSIIELAWKFQLLKKCILEGRMEIRVQGVETMQQELVGVYNKYVQRNNAYKDHPVAQYLSDFMLANRLVEYFVGVESHPQLINRCGNIIGFLVITSRYSEAESDAIWKAVTTSPDSRIVDAILQMLMSFFNISPYETLLYLTSKLINLPLQAFDSSMIIYGRALLENLRRTWKDQRPDGRLDMPPYHLCIRLIRQSAAEKSISFHRTREIHIFALTELQSLLNLGPSDNDRRLIYEECVKDISCRTPYATGSFSAINALLAQNPEGDIRMLADESDLTNLVIEDFAHVIDTENSLSLTSRTLDESLTVRLELLQSIIIHIPDTITVEAGQRLWDVMLGRNALHDRARQSAWNILSNAVSGCQKRNSFIDRCIGDYLPQLDPKFISVGCLSFVQQVTHYESSLAHLRLDAQEYQIGPLGSELLWHISLAAPTGGIELEAIHMLVALYLDSPKSIDKSQVALEAMQIDVVERCIGQLKSAALKLKSFNDGTSSGEDEPMVVVASNEEVNTSRMAFARSLLILKEFVQGVRSRPRYSPPPSKKPQISSDVRDIKGDSFQIRYQSFSGGTNTGIHSIEIGDLETIDDLSQRLIALTGFSKFTAIAGGQKLDLASNWNTTLREMKFDQKGLLIVKKAHSANSLPDLAPAPELRPLELEVLKNFPDLYQLLSTEEELAKEVRTNHSFLNLQCSRIMIHRYSISCWRSHPTRALRR